MYTLLGRCQAIPMLAVPNTQIRQVSSSDLAADSVFNDNMGEEIRGAKKEVGIWRPLCPATLVKLGQRFSKLDQLNLDLIVRLNNMLFYIFAL